MKYGLTSQQIVIHNCAVADKMGKVVFSRYENNNGEGSKITDYENEGNCKVVCLDEYLKEPYTFLKADIESFEYRMLQGAIRGIIAVSYTHLDVYKRQVNYCKPYDIVV